MSELEINPTKIQGPPKKFLEGQHVRNVEMSLLRGRLVVTSGLSLQPRNRHNTQPASPLDLRGYMSLLGDVTAGCSADPMVSQVSVANGVLLGAFGRLCG
jgi:hypothetical protein